MPKTNVSYCLLDGSTASTSCPPRSDDKYLRHVVLKFITGTTAESTALVKALAAVLRLSADEEKLVGKTLKVLQFSIFYNMYSSWTVVIALT